MKVYFKIYRNYYAYEVWGTGKYFLCKVNGKVFMYATTLDVARGIVLKLGQ